MSRRLPILTFHAIDDQPSPVTMTASRFGRIIEALAAGGWRTLTVDGLVAGHARGEWPAQSLLLTFDDGFSSFGETAWPILRRYGFTATVFAVSQWAGRTNDWPGQPSWVPRRPLLGWDDLRALAREGASVGAHSATHRVLTDLTPADQEREISGAKDDIEQHIGRAVDLFAYPYGRTSATVEARVRSHYRAGVGTRLDFARPGASLAALDRIDAYYLSPASARVLDSARLAAYLAARRIGRRLRALGR